MQGKFQVERTGGKAVVRNGLGNRGLFARTAPSAFRTLKADAATTLRPDPGDIDLTTFLELCKEAR